MKAGNAFGLCSAVSLCAVAGMATSVSAAPLNKQIQAYEQPLKRAVPTAYRGVRLVSVNPLRIEPTTDWIPYKDHGGARLTSERYYDAYEGENGNKMGGPPVNGTECGLSGSGYRWYFGTAYTNPQYVNDMTLDPIGHGQEAINTDYAFYFGGLEPNLSYYHFPLEEADSATCSDDPLAGTIYDGLQVNYVSIPAGGWYSDLEHPDVPLQMPTDGVGGHYSIFGNDDGSVGIILAQNAQPFLWGTGEDETVPDGRRGSQDFIQWDDDSTSAGGVCGTTNTPNGTFDAGCECYDYTAGLCPDPLGAMLSFGGPGGGTGCYADFNGDGSLTPADFSAFRTAFLAGDTSADCDTSGTLTPADFSCFRSAFLAGCP